MIDHPELADALIQTLNELLESDPNVPAMLDALIRHRISCSAALRGHPTIQVDGDEGSYRVGFLGILNGLCGVIGGKGECKDWGYITSVHEEDGTVSGFRRTEE